MMFHNILNVITIIEKVNPHPRPKRAIVEIMFILTHGILVSKEILMSRLEQIRGIREQLVNKGHKIFEANRLGRI